MKCKICNKPVDEIKYLLRDAKILLCRECGCHFSDYLDKESEEIPTDQITTEQHIPAELKMYIRHSLQNNKSKFGNQVHISLGYLQNPKAAKILDVGSGGGLFLSMMKSMGVQDCFGIELDLQRLNFSRQEYGLNQIFPHRIESPFWSQNHKSSFDLITLWDVIEHVNHPLEIIKAANSLLKKNGILIIDTPCRDTFYYKFGEFTYSVTNGKFPTFLNLMYSDQPFGHKQILSKKDMERLFIDTGFKMIHLNVFHELSFPIDYYLTKLFKSKLMLKILTPLVKILIEKTTIKNKMLVVGKN